MSYDKIYGAIEEALESEYEAMFDRPNEELEAFLDELDTQARIEQEAPSYAWQAPIEYEEE